MNQISKLNLFKLDAHLIILTLEKLF